MSNEVKILGESLIQKLSNFGFKVNRFTHTKKAFLSDTSQKDISSSLSGFGKQDRMAELQEALNDQEREVEMDIDFSHRSEINAQIFQSSTRLMAKTSCLPLQQKIPRLS